MRLILAKYPMVNTLNLNYLRGLYVFLIEKSDEELELFDINSLEDRKILFERMKHTFSGFGPISRENVINGLEFVWRCFSDDEIWRNAIPHDLPLAGVVDRRNYLEQMSLALTGRTPSARMRRDFFLVDEIGPVGLDYSK